MILGSIFTKHGTEIILDNDDYDKAREYSWIIDHQVPKTLIDGKRVSIEKLIFGANQSQRIIHLNKNIYDFRRNNISICSRETYRYLARAETRRIHSKYYGVVKAKKAWAAKVYSSDTKQRYETYHTEWEAAVAADYYAIIKYKEFALRNFPEMPFEEIREIRDKAYAEIQNNKFEYRSHIMQGVSRPKRNKSHENRSNFVGINRVSDSSWEVCIRHKEKYYCGRFYSEEDAAIVYDMKAIEIYGEEAKRNFPEIEIGKLKTLYKKILTKYGKIAAHNASKVRQGWKTKKKKVTSQYLGVAFNERTGSWVAGITLNYKRYHIGTFDSEIDAARAYDCKALELYGEEAKVNFPESRGKKYENV